MATLIIGKKNIKIYEKNNKHAQISMTIIQSHYIGSAYDANGNKIKNYKVELCTSHTRHSMILVITKGKNDVYTLIDKKKIYYIHDY